MNLLLWLYFKLFLDCATLCQSTWETKDLPNLSGYFQVSQAFVNKGQQSETDSSMLCKLTAN